MKKAKSEPILSAEHVKYVKRLKVKKISIFGAQIGVLLLIIGLWELLTFVGAMDPFFMSSPSRIFKTLQGMLISGEIWHHMGVTLYECILGFVIASLLGIVIAAALWWNDTLRKICDPYIVVLNSLPKIALGPIIIIWVGVGVKAIVVMCVLISLIVTILSVLNGFLACDPDKILLFKAMGASKWQIFSKLVFPNAIPDLIAALKMNIGLAWVGTIMGEYLSSKAGLGYLIVYGGQVFNLDLVMCSTVLLCVMATGMYLVVSIIEKKIKSKR